MMNESMPSAASLQATNQNMVPLTFYCGRLEGGGGGGGGCGGGL